jgi:hypothetical protein
MLERLGHGHSEGHIGKGEYRGKHVLGSCWDFGGRESRSDSHAMKQYEKL